MNLGTLALTCLALLVGQAPDDSHFTRERNHRIPINYENMNRAEIRELRLFASTDQGRSWQLVARAEPDQDAFVFYAPGDGAYWLQVAVANKAGEQIPANVATLKPAQKLVIDTARPIVHSLNARREGDDILASWQLQEEFPDWTSFRLEYQPKDAGTNWAPINAQAGVSGQITFRSTSPQPLTVRLSMRDLAGNQSFAQAEIPGNRTVTAAYTPAVGSGINIAPPQGTMPPPPPGTLPSLPREVAVPTPMSAALPPPPAPSAVLQTTGGGDPLPRLGSAPPPPSAPLPDPRPPVAAPVTVAAPNPTAPTERVIGSSTDSAPAPEPKAPAPSPADQLSPVGPPTAGPAPVAPPRPQAPLQYVNHPEVTLEFEVSRIGPSGLGAVELWGTKDEGQSWVLYAYDAKPQESGAGNRQKRTLELRTKNGYEEGVYGFRLVLKNPLKLGKAPPAPGDAPELRIELDTTAPLVTFLNPIPDPQKSDAVLLRWTAKDKNLDKAPVALEWSEKREGPWQTIAQDLPNSGQQSWQPTKDIPVKVYLRIRVRDLAGNESIAVSHEPEAIDPNDLSVPEGHLVGVVAPQRREP